MIVGIISSASASMTPPPSTTTSGLSKFTRLATVSPANGFANVATAHVFQVVAEHISELTLLAVLDCGLNSPKQGEAAGEHFEAASVAATALGPIHIDDHVSQFSRRMPEAGVEFTVDNESASDARADENPNYVLGLRSQFLFVHAQHANVAVVLEEHREVQSLFQLFHDGDIPPLKVGRKNDFAMFRIDHAGGANSDISNLFQIEIALINRVQDTAGNSFEHGVMPALGLGAEFSGAQRLQLRIENAGEDFGAAQIDSDDVIASITFGHGKNSVWPAGFD